MLLTKYSNKTIMEAKQSAIKNAYGKFYDSGINEDGWARFRPQYQKDKTWYDAFHLDVIETSLGVLYRPISLRNLETNNGWITILPDGSNLPKIEEIEYNLFWIINKAGHIFSDGFGRNKKSKWINCFTHYRPIIKPQPPIY